MRRPLAALLLGAVSLAALVPVAAGANELPKVPFTGRKTPALKIACDIVRSDGGPAVSCTWSTPPVPAVAAVPVAATDPVRPAPFVYRLGRVGRDGRTVVYKGGDTSFVDTTVEPGQKYGYRVQAFNANGRPVAGSGTVRVAVPDPGPDHLRFSCAAESRNTGPAVGCKWSPSERKGFDHYRLFRLELNASDWRHVIYRGTEPSFVDEKVEAGHRYKYLVQAVDKAGRVIGTSDVADVAVPPVVIVDPPKPTDPCRPAPTNDAAAVAKCRPTDRPCPAASDTAAKCRPIDPPCPAASDTAAKCRPIDPPCRPAAADAASAGDTVRCRPPVPGPKPEPTPTPDPVPVPGPRPVPVPVPDPTPVPVPGPRPVPPVVRMKLACEPQRFDVRANAVTDNATKFAPAGPVVACEWAAPADIKVAGFRLWRADRPEGTKQVIFKSAADVTRFVDRTVSPGHGYLYMVEAIGADGRVVAQSDAVTVKLPATATVDSAVS